MQQLRKKFEKEEIGKKSLQGRSGAARTGKDDSGSHEDTALVKKNVGQTMKWGAKSLGREDPIEERRMKTTNKSEMNSLGPKKKIFLEQPRDVGKRKVWTPKTNPEMAKANAILD